MNKPGYLTITYPNGFETTVPVKDYSAACKLASAWILSVEPTPCRAGFDCPDDRGGTAFYSLDLTSEAEEALSTSRERTEAKNAVLREKYGNDWHLYR